jgi:hypothetical protein
MLLIVGRAAHLMYKQRSHTLLSGMAAVQHLVLQCWRSLLL